MSAAEAIDASQLIDIRPATGDDVPWIFSSWLKSFREHGSNCGRIAKETYWAEQRRIINAVTSTPGCVTLVACPSENAQQILGWLCGRRMSEREIGFYYGHVKSERRQQGIMRALVQAFGVNEHTRCYYAHHTRLSWLDENNTPHSKPLGDIVPPGWSFNPYLLM